MKERENMFEYSLFHSLQPSEKEGRHTFGIKLSKDNRGQCDEIINV